MKYVSILALVQPVNRDKLLDLLQICDLG